MISERHDRFLRGLWLAVYCVLGAVVFVLAAIDWRRYMEIIAPLGFVLCMLTGSWPVLFPMRLRKHGSQTGPSRLARPQPRSR